MNLAEGGEDGEQGDQIEKADTGSHGQIVSGRSPSFKDDGDSPKRAGGKRGYQENELALVVEAGVVDPAQADLAYSLQTEDQEDQEQMAASGEIAGVALSPGHQHQADQGESDTCDLRVGGGFFPQPDRGDDGHQNRQAKGGENHPDVGDLQGARHNEHGDDKSASGEETDLEKRTGEHQVAPQSEVDDQRGGQDQVVDGNDGWGVAAAALGELEELAEAE